MSIKAMVWAWKQDVKPNEKIVLLALADHAHDDGRCWPGQEGLADKCGMSRRTVIYCINSLKDKGIIKATKRSDDQGYRATNLYQLNLSESKVQDLHLGKSNVQNLSSNVQNLSSNVQDLHSIETLEETSIETKPPTPLKKERCYPANLNVGAYEEFKAHRKEIHKSIKPTGEKRLISTLTKYSLDQQAQLINTSISCGWQGIFPQHLPTNGNGQAKIHVPSIHDEKGLKTMARELGINATRCDSFQELQKRIVSTLENLQNGG